MRRLHTSIVLLLLSSCETESLEHQPSEIPLLDASAPLEMDGGDEPDAATGRNPDAHDPYVQYPTTCSDTTAKRVGPFLLSTGDIVMGDAAILVGKGVEVLLTNTSSAPVSVPIIDMVSGRRFGFNAVFPMRCVEPMQPGGSCLLEVSFWPESRGSVTGVIRISTRAGESTLIAVCGTGLARLE